MQFNISDKNIINWLCTVNRKMTFTTYQRHSAIGMPNSMEEK
jgi:hypothetical protein